MEELETNKLKAEDYLDVIIDMHKRFVNSEHVEFKKMRKLKKGMGIRFRNNFNLWFQEEIASDPSDTNQGIKHYFMLVRIIWVTFIKELFVFNTTNSFDFAFFVEEMMMNFKMPTELKQMKIKVNQEVINRKTNVKVVTANFLIVLSNFTHLFFSQFI